MKKTKIEWTDHTWNPIKGLCPVGCWYCYAKRIHKRFGWEDSLRINFKVLNRTMPKRPSKIFVCSIIELFHPDIGMEWRDYIFNIIKLYPQHSFQILTKNPQNIGREMPHNVWLGVSITRQSELWRLSSLIRIQAKLRFVSFEPLFEFIRTDGYRFEFSQLDWMIVGRLNHFGKKYDINEYTLNQMRFYAEFYGIPLFMKNNLKDIWKCKLVQEFPE